MLFCHFWLIVSLSHWFVFSFSFPHVLFFLHLVAVNLSILVFKSLCSSCALFFLLPYVPCVFVVFHYVLNSVKSWIFALAHFGFHSLFFHFAMWKIHFMSSVSTTDLCSPDITTNIYISLTFLLKKRKTLVAESWIHNSFLNPTTTGTR